MSVVTRINEAKRDHEALRAEPAASGNLAEKALLCKRVKVLMDELWLATPQASSGKALRSAIRRLTIDAEYFAGLTDGEGFRDPAELWVQYELLETAFAGN